jgi:hypothetical protein
MRGVVVHAGLLAVALVAALATWLRDDAGPAGDAGIPIWDRPAADVVGIKFRSGARTVEVERRGGGAGAHLWGRETRPVGVFVADTAAADGTPPMRTEEFPGGEVAETLFERWARLQATRDLGAADAAGREAYGLTDDSTTIEVRFRDGGSRAFVLGGTVVGGGARYVLDTDRGHLYVLPTGLISPLENGATTLRLTSHHGFQPGDVATVTVRASGGERTMQRRAPADPGARPTWVSPDSDRADAAFGGFMEQIDQIWISRFAPDVSTDGLPPLVRIDYADARGRALGYLELFAAQTADGERVYYMRTPRTIVSAEIYAPIGERIEQDLQVLFGRSSAAGTRTPPPAD